ncbi:hypothetical protein Hdeb2414_s0388g00883311 [Helianthus debilis subsp. tardiflorus]
MLLVIFLQLGSRWLMFLVFLFWLSSRSRKSQDLKLSEVFFFFFLLILKCLLRSLIYKPVVRKRLFCPPILFAIFIVFF